MAIDANSKECPICGGEMWNNTFKKSKGEMNPKAPDYKCKDKTCEGVIWPPKSTTPQSIDENTPAPKWSREKLPETQKSSFNTCNAMNNAVALIVGGVRPYEDLKEIYDHLLAILES